MAVARGCGTRCAGGIYLETLLSWSGRPIEHYLMDPVSPLPQGYRVAAVGMSFVEQPETGVVHVVDWVGGEYYPNVSDFVEEVKRFGVSRRVPKGAPFERLTRRSRLLLVHGRAYVSNHQDYQPITYCPRGQHDPVNRPPEGTHCAGLWWNDVTGGEPQEHGGDRAVVRTMPSFSYFARSRPPDVSPSYAPGIFAAFPIGRLVVVEDPAGGTHTLALRAAEKAQMYFDIVQESE